MAFCCASTLVLRTNDVNPNPVIGRCVFSEPEVLDNFIDVGGDVAYLQEAASDVYTARAWIFGFGFCFSTVSFVFLVACLYDRTAKAVIRV